MENPGHLPAARAADLPVAQRIHEQARKQARRDVIALRRTEGCRSGVARVRPSQMDPGPCLHAGRANRRRGRAAPGHTRPIRRQSALRSQSDGRACSAANQTLARAPQPIRRQSALRSQSDGRARPAANQTGSSPREEARRDADQRARQTERPHRVVYLYGFEEYSPLQ
ncbi:uncharacterized protein LOC114790140 isoform X3 [Denticeps clupeoides]|uniref:uncharacterized protein LOC114790140 isoform X3 n=1 Tax=Denticeps clupeoides TaxID=299321 RepID=UPI0010A44E0C|nr:uncharacterized protein LOC114790140 isoform X3 [Denticeps clupeoides]